MTTLRRTTSLLAVLAMLMTLTAVPAFAVANGAATITSGDLLSGQGGQVNVRITNNASAGVLGLASGSAIDAFIIEVPQDLVNVAAADVALPSGWTGGYDSEVGFVYGEAGDGSELAPGEAMDIAIGVTADAIPDDRTRKFTTSVSDNGGTTMSSAGAPTVTSRILKIVDTVLVKPSQATNADTSQVTAQQDNADFVVRVQNFGTQARTVTANVERVSGTSTVTTTAGSAPVSSGGSASIPVDATFGDPGSLTVRGTATSPNSAAVPVNAEALTVQAAFAANLVANSLEPKAVVQGGTYNLSYRINKTAGAQPVTGSSTFSFGGFSTSANQSFDATNSQKTVSFPNVTIPDLANGDYQTSSTIDGFDANGAVVALSLEPGTLTLDNLLPVVNITLDVGEPDIEGAAAATTSGRSISYSGSIGLSGGAGGCSNCTITKAVLVALPSGTELPMNITNTGGDLSGSQSFTFPAGTTSAVARVTAQRNSTGATGQGVSNTVTVDLVQPRLFDPGITFRDEAADKIIINLVDDGLLVDTSGSTIADWSVDNNTVTAISATPNRGAATQLVLTLQSRLDDNATPVVSYSARPLISTRMHDRVSLTVADQAIDTIDGIIPAAPVIDTVSGLALQDGEFWTNDSTPEVGLSSLVAGNVLEIYYDTNDNGAPESTERVYVGGVDSDTATVTLSSLGTVEVGHALLARMRDDAGNLGVLAEEVLNLDFTAAVITDIRPASGQDVTVVFNEPVARGRNAAFDWAVLATQNGTTAYRTVTQVAAGENASERVLTINSDSYDASAGGSLDGVRYKFRGADGERYQDRATNVVIDTVYSE